MSGRRGKLLGRLNIYGIKMSLILSFMMLISIIVLFLSIISYHYTMNDFENMSISYTIRLLNEINSSIDTYVDNMKSMARVVVENKDVRDLMSYCNSYSDTPRSDSEKQELTELSSRAAFHMNTVANTRGDITNIAVISKYGDVVLSDRGKRVNAFSGYGQTDWFQEALARPSEMIVSPSHVQNLIAGEYKWVISISKAITDAVTGEITGVMVIDLNFRSIEAICENAQLGKSGYIYLIDSKKDIIFHPQQQLLYSGVKTENIDAVLQMSGGEAYLRDDTLGKIYIRNDSHITGWNAVGVVNTDELIRNKAGIINFYCLLAAVSILFATAIAVTISTTITKPIRMLENTMHKAEEGDFTVRSEIELNNEIGHLSKTFNVMIVKLKLLMDNAVANEEEKRKSEIKALQAQINPHFLYNTLDTIIWMSASGKNEEVVEVTSALARLFRSSISRGGNLVTLDVELENIQSYLTIQKMRYKDRLTYRVEIPTELRGMMTPKLILQPIVENAVYHGVKLAPEGGSIRISGRREQDLLILTVEDSGVGMTPEQISQIFLPKEDSDRGIGIINVNNRIKLCFGEQYGLNYYSDKGKGTRVEINLPVIEGGEEQNE